MKTQIAAIEFGTSKIVTVIAENGGFNRCNIIGSGTVPYDGYSNSEWNAQKKLAQAVYNSIRAAEKDANKKIEDIYIGVPCEFINVRNAKATVPIRGERQHVSDEDIDKVQDMAAGVFRFDREGGNVIHRSPAWFSVDGGKRTMMPLNVAGQNLTACVSFIVVHPEFIEDMRSLMGSMGIAINGFLSTSFGEQLLLTTAEEREKPIIFVNVGALNTEVSVVEGDAMVYHAVIPQGGTNVTEDLAEAMDIFYEDAENLKRSMILDTDGFKTDGELVFADENGREMNFDPKFVEQCMKTALDSLCDMIQRTIEDAGNSVLPRSQVYLTGGGLALMRGGREYLAGQLKRPVKKPQLRTTKLNSPDYSSIIGLVDLIFDSIGEHTPEMDNLPGRLADGFRSLLGKGK